MISYGGRKPLSGADRITAPAMERAQAFATFFSYGGRYSIDGDNVIHHVEISSVQNWVNTDLVRAIKFDGDRITYERRRYQSEVLPGRPNWFLNASTRRKLGNVVFNAQD